MPQVGDPGSHAGQQRFGQQPGRGTGISRRLQVPLAIFAATVSLVMAIVMMAVVASASAAPKSVVGYFGNPTASHSALAGEFNVVQGVAVNSSGAGPADAGDVYVVDQGNNRVQRFSSLGQFEVAWGRDVIKPNPDVNADLGDVFERCTFALDCKPGLTGPLGGELFTPRGIAVDQITGNVYVVERGGSTIAPRVQAFTGDGEFLWALGKDVVANGSPSDPSNVVTTQVCVVAADCKTAAFGTAGGEFGVGGTSTPSGGGNGIAVSPIANGVTGAGNVLVTDRANRRVQEFTSTGSFVRAFGWDTITNGSPSDPGSETMFQVCTVAADCKDGTAGAEPGRFGANSPNRVAVDSTGAIYTVENSANFRLQKFAPQVGPPDLAPTVVNASIGGSTTLSGTASSSTPMDVAVGASDHVFVLRAFDVGAGTPPAAVAERRVVELDSAGALVDTHATLAGIQGSTDLAVNPATSDVYMSTASPGAGNGEGIYVLGPALAPPTVSIGVGGVGTHTAQLNGIVGPGGPGTLIGIPTQYRFEYREVGAPSWIALSADKDAGNGFATVPVAHALTDLDANTAYEARLVASRKFSGVPDSVTPVEVFTTQASRPDIDAVYATDRSQTAATLNARVNPNGSATGYRFEYGPTAAYGTTVPVPDASAGSGVASLIFSEAISGLSADTTYHYRLIATNANGTNTSPDKTFTTRPDLSPDAARAYELVSPADKTGGTGVSTWYAGVGTHGNTGVPAYDGDRYVSSTFYGGSIANGGFSYGADASLGQRTHQGWINKPAFNKLGGLGYSEFAKLPTFHSMSDDLSLVAWYSQSQLAIFPEQQEIWGPDFGAVQGPALREWDSGRWEITAPLEPSQKSGNSGVFAQVAADGGYALVAGAIRGVAGPGDPSNAAFSGGSSDLFCSSASACNRNVYVDDVSAGLSDSYPGDGIRSLINVCTGEGAGRTAVPRVDGGGKVAAASCPPAPAGRDARMISPRGASVAGDSQLPGHISEDGSRVFFMSPDHLTTANNVACVSVSGDVEGTRCPPQVYVSQRNPDGSFTTRWISESVVAGQDAGLLAAAVFEGATPDGDKAFFRTASPLTADDPNGGVQQPGGVKTGTANPNSVDLFMYDFPDAEGADLGDGTLTRISAGPTGTADANVSTDAVDTYSTALRALARDGSRVYFVTASPLPGVPASSDGTVTTPGGTPSQTTTRNLYLYDANQPTGQRWRFIAQLPATSALGNCAAKGALLTRNGLDAVNGGLQGTVMAESAGRCVRNSEDGSFLTLFTDGRLTADDPDAVSGDVYAYDVVTDELTRVSAAQGGVGGSYQCVTASGAGLGTQCNGDPFVSSLATQAPLNMVPGAGPGERVVFFESASRLVPGDQNDVYDVYQWRNGVLSLLSTGAAGAEPALYRGNDRTGANVYISTRDRWSWQDYDVVLDVYSARTGGGIPEPTPPPACAALGGTCRTGGADVVPVPSSQTSIPGGAGNVVAGRVRLSVAGVSRRARVRAGRFGVLRVVVRASIGGTVRGVVRARLGGRVRTVGTGSTRLQRAGRARVALRLNRVARERLRSGRSLVVVVGLRLAGAPGRSMTVRLPGAGS